MRAAVARWSPEWWFRAAEAVCAAGILVVLGLVTPGPLHVAVVAAGKFVWSVIHTFSLMYGGGSAGGGTAAAGGAAGTTAP